MREEVLPSSLSLLTIEGGSSRDSLRYILLFAVRKDAALPANDLSAPYGYDTSSRKAAASRLLFSLHF